MKTFRSPELLQRTLQVRRFQGKKIGLVPTMGALHAGHLSLVRRARKENDLVVVSIFVNALQFGLREDLKHYPRTWKADQRLLNREKVDFIFAPSSAQMYPEGYSADVDLANSNLTQILCGKSRPGHFKGVATVVAKLFNIAKPNRAYFGAKDFQQAAVIGRLIRDLNFEITLRVLPIVREKDGLALSSRNRYLNVSQRARAQALSQTLFWMRRELKRGKPLGAVKRAGTNRLKKQVDRMEYLEIVDPVSLQPLKRRQAKMVALTACFVGKTRLIDNVIIRT